MSTSSVSSSTLSSLGVGSGLDVNGIISKLMAIESKPLNNLSTQNSQLNTQLSAYGQIKSDLDAFKSAASAIKDSGNYNAFKTDSSNSTAVTATADSSATTGAHTVNVSQLAKSEIQVGTESFASTTDALSLAGTLEFTQNGNTFSIDIDTDSSLQNIKDSINNASDNTGVSASILNDGSGNRLVLTAKNSGSANSITVAGDNAATLGFNNTARYDETGAEVDPTGSITQSAQDAIVTIDGIPVTKSSNSISDAIPGVTLQLKDVGNSTVNTTRDMTTITKSITDFAAAYSKLAKTINTLHQKGGTLEADNTAISILGRLQSEFNTSANIAGSSISYLAQIGISFQKDGSLTVDNTALTSALNTNFNQTVSLLTDSDQGFANRLFNASNDLLTTGGLVTSKQDSINTQMRNIKDQSARMQVLLDSKQKQLQTQYTALDKLMGQMSSTSAFLTKQLK